jgi:hypothetical protein
MNQTLIKILLLVLLGILGLGAIQQSSSISGNAACFCKKNVLDIVRPGMTSTQVESQIGKPNRVIGHGQAMDYYYKQDHLIVLFVHDRVVGIQFVDE